MDNDNNLCLVKYVWIVQLEKNTTYHPTIGMTPLEALFNRKPSFGLSDLGIPSELALEIHDEADLEKVIDEIHIPDRSYMESNSTTLSQVRLLLLLILHLFLSVIPQVT